MKKETIFLLDGNALCYRAFYAIKELSNSKGFPTNAVYGVINMVRKLVDDFGPDMMAVAFDVKGPTDRHKKFKEYKIHRKPMPEELVLQMPKIKEVIGANNIPMFEIEGHEADDVIATLATRIADQGVKVVVVTSDKDAFQLINKDITVLSPHLKEAKVYGRDEVVEKFGVRPDRITELMALMGDSSDNVPGVKGVGIVTAKKLINEFDSIDNLYENIDKISSKTLSEKLIKGKEDAFLSRELVILNRDLPIKFDLTSMRVTRPDRERLSELYKEFEFRALLKGLMPANHGKTSHNVHASVKEVSKIIDSVKKQKTVAFRLAYDDPDGKFYGIAVSWKMDEAHYISFKDIAPDSDVFERCKDILEDENIVKVGHDLKADLMFLKRSGIGMNNIFFDVMIADYLIDPIIAGHGLSDITARKLGYSLKDSKSGVDWESSGQATLDFDAPEISPENICEEVSAIFSLFSDMKDALKQKGLFTLFREVEMPLVEVLASMEMEGIGIDIKYLEKQSVRLDGELKDMTKKICSSAGEEFNINSPKQLQVILFDKLKLPVIKKTKTGASTDESVLRKLADHHELPSLILDYRTISKLKNTYYDGLIRVADQSSGKLHTSFNQAVTATGRLSSSEPNLQNIPIRTSLGREIRRAFIPLDKNDVLLAADYSQVELRILAHLSRDKELIKAFNEDEDIHEYTASLVFDVPLRSVDSQMRSAAKTVNFGIIYGMGPFSLAKDLGISVGEAERFIDAYFKRYKGVKGFIDSTLDDARKKGYVTTFLNRRRDIPEIKSKNQHIRGFAERTAINTPVQGSAADLIKLSMLSVWTEKTISRMILQVHDELIFSVPREGYKDSAKKIKDLMENVMDLKVPLKVDLEFGGNWMEMEEIAW